MPFLRLNIEIYSVCLPFSPSTQHSNFEFFKKSLPTPFLPFSKFGSLITDTETTMCELCAILAEIFDKSFIFPNVGEECLLQFLYMGG